MQETPNLKLKKPDLTDYVNVGDLNENADIIDTEITENKEDLATHLEEFAQHIEDETAHGIGDKSALKTVEKGTIVNAVNELFTNVSDGKLLVGGAITDVDNKVNVPTDPTFQELADAIGQINVGYIDEMSAGNSMAYLDPTGSGSESSVYEKNREVKVTIPGTYRISYSIKAKNSGNQTYSRIYVNDNPVGLERNSSGTSERTFVEDITLKENQVVQLYARATGNYSGYTVKDFSIGIDTSDILVKLM